MTITSLNIAEGTVGKKCMPQIKRRYVALAIVLILVCVALILAQMFGAFAPKDGAKVLVPPDPTTALPPSKSALHMFKKGAVCADGVPCAEIGKNILDRNGTAVDATIAAMFCNGLVNMQSMGIGGGFLMTIYTRNNREATTLDAREAAPLRSTPDMFKTDAEEAKWGPLAIGVPGELKGYWEAHKRYGRLPWKDLVAPTLALCATGYNLTRIQYDSLYNNKNTKVDPILRSWFVVETNDTFKPSGSLIRPQELCETLKTIAELGGDDLYNGSLAAKLSEDLKQMKSIITKDDLANYKARWLPPVNATFNNGDVLYSVPPPGSGVLLAFILNILDGFNFTRNSVDGVENTVRTYHRTLEAFKFAYAKRTELGDTDFVDIDKLLRNLTSRAYAEGVRTQISDASAGTDPQKYGAVFFSQSEDHGTAHLSVLAPNGDAVSVTSTVNIYFGSGRVSKSTGILMNNVMDDFSSPGFKNYFNLPGSPNNKIEPGKRPLSSMSPAIVVDRNGDVKVVVGASGGTKITTAIAQVLMRILWFGDNIKEAVDAPRIHHQLYPMEVAYEYGVMQQIVSGLEALGHKTVRYRDRGSIVCALLKDLQKSGYIFANADYRKGGDVFGID